MRGSPLASRGTKTDFGRMQRRTAIVTGANRGIGLEIARQLAAAGVRVIATCRGDAEGRRAARDLGVDYHRLDVTQEDSIADLADDLRDGFDILVNNAGISVRGFDAEVVRQTLAVNFFGAMNMTERLLPLLRARGRIVMISSGMGELSCLSAELRARFDDPALTKAELVDLMRSFVRDVTDGVHEKKGWPSSAYRVSKVGLNALTRVLARELGSDPRGLLVNAACPGWVRTGMGGASAPRSPEQGARTPVWLALLPKDGPSGGFFRDERPIAF
jgi:NAD(P)-dependent dehydrogenase (short-subunit alcohol dehydrogenase family)